MARKSPQKPPGKAEASARDTRRRFEQWVKNPACQANTYSAVHGISMAEVARSEGVALRSGQSPFALARGQNFERMLFKKDGERLREELQHKGVLPKGEIHFADLRLRQHGGTHHDLDTARSATSHLLRSIAATPRTTWLIASPTILIPGGVMLPEAMLVIDVLVARPREEKVELVIGEIKTYPDRGGYTDGQELAVARAQAGVYVHGLKLVVGELGLEAGIMVSDKGFLVLSKPGSNFPSVRADEDLKYQALRAERGFEALSKAAVALPAHPERARLEAVCTAEVAYGQACISFCDRVAVCHARALEAGQPAVLGDEMERFLGEIDLHRATALLTRGKAKTPAEIELQERLRRARGLEPAC